jgi:phospholipase/carboxylesterase
MDRIALGGGEAVVVGSLVPNRCVVVFLHGFAMLPEDLAPFSAAVGGETVFVFPRGNLTVEAGTLGRAEATATWWPVDPQARAAAMARGPRDLSSHFPEGVELARAHLDTLVATLRSELRPSRLLVGGFSQGAMLTLEWQLHAAVPAEALVLMSAARIRAPLWEPLLPKFQRLPIFQSHGRSDPDLSFQAASELRDTLVAHRADVHWLPFEGGHETPLSVWRGVRRFLRHIGE